MFLLVTLIYFLPKFICPDQIVSFIYLRSAIRIATTSGKEHPFIMEAYVIDQCKLTIGNRLFKRPEKVVCRSHKQSTVLDWIPLIPSKWRSSIFLSNTAEPLINAFILAETFQKYNGNAKTIQSAFIILGMISLKESFWIHGFPYRQTLQPRQPLTSFFKRDINSTLCPASSGPLIKCSTNYAVFPFGLLPPCIISIFFISISPPIYFCGSSISSTTLPSLKLS